MIGEAWKINRYLSAEDLQNHERAAEVLISSPPDRSRTRKNF
jgi:hypothetical protein